MYKKRGDLKKQVKVFKHKMGVEAKKAKLLEYKGSTERNRTVLESISTEIRELDVEIYELTYKIEDLIYRYPHLVPIK